MRVLAVDLGKRRIGLAISDSSGTLASPHSVLIRSGNDPSEDHRRIATIVEDESAGHVIVGLPIDLAGKRGIAAEEVLAEVADLATVVGVPVETYDERMTTVMARRSMAASGTDTKSGRSRIDAAAAAVLLQSWLDLHKAQAANEEAR